MENLFVDPEIVARISLAAHRHAVRFADADDLPVRYRNLSDPSRPVRKAKEDSDIEKRFSKAVECWTTTIHAMHARIEVGQAWRFVELTPRIDESNTLGGNRDFCDFVDYMARRRDVEVCDDDELGTLSQLLLAFQRKVESLLPK
jgi:hypothetical protein